eukprot:983323-Amphidinium_carterae.2
MSVPRANDKIAAGWLWKLISVCNSIELISSLALFCCPEPGPGHLYMPAWDASLLSWLSCQDDNVIAVFQLLPCTELLHATLE